MDVLPNPALKTAVANAIGIDRLSLGRHELSGEIIEIDAIWIIEFPHYFGADIFLVGVVQVDYVPVELEGDTAWQLTPSYRQMLLASQFSKFQFMGTQPPKLVEVAYPDEMITHLQNMDLMPFYSHVFELDGYATEFILHIYSGQSELHWKFYGSNPQKRLQAFESSILTTVRHLAEQCDDPVIKDIVRMGRNPYR
jgi:hypothetical protein